MNEASVQIKNMDHLGLVAGMIDILEIEKSIDKRVTYTSHKKALSYGTLVKAMILNGLGFVNKQLYLTPDFFRDKPLEKLFGRAVEADQFNDDALGRTLDAIYDYGTSELYKEVAHEALDVLALKPKRIHLDSTSFHVDGRYNSREQKQEG